MKTTGPHPVFRRQSGGHWHFESGSSEDNFRAPLRWGICAERSPLQQSRRCRRRRRQQDLQWYVSTDMRVRECVSLQAYNHYHICDCPFFFSESEASYARDAFAKAIYERLFSTIVSKVNDVIQVENPTEDTFYARGKEKGLPGTKKLWRLKTEALHARLRECERSED